MLESVFFKVCVSTAWIDVWESTLAHSCVCSGGQIQTDYVKGLNMGEWESGNNIPAPLWINL